MAEQQQTAAAPRRVGAYSVAIEWIALNDDTEWLDEGENASPSVTLCLVADVFGRSVERATADLRRIMAREKRARAMLEQARATARAAIAAATGGR